MTNGQPFRLKLREAQGHIEAEGDFVNCLNIANDPLGGEVDEEGGGGGEGKHGEDGGGE